jgi:uncharacterized membrane protein
MQSSVRAFFVVLLAASGCVNSTEEGAPTGSVCDPALNYEGDIAPIMTRYCVSCHSASVPLKERHGAPGDRNFDGEADVLENALHIQERAGSGPDADNHSMPPRGFRAPSAEQRITLARFLECQLESGESAPMHHH